MSEAMQSYDTHKHIKQLQAVGFKEQQAEVLVHSLFVSRDNDFSKLATKEQVYSLKKSTEEKFTSLEKSIRDHVAAETAKIHASIAEVQTTMIKWMIGIMVAFSGIILTAMKLFV